MITAERTRTRTISWEDPLATAAEAAGRTGLEFLQAMIDGEIPVPPISETLRMAPVEISEGRAVFEGTPGEEHFNPIGMVHGGYASTLLDSAMGCAVHTTLAAGVAYTTQTLEVKFVRPITSQIGTIRVEGTVVHRGRRQATTEGRVYDAGGKLLAHATGTCLILS